MDRIIDRHGLPKYTDETITSREALFDELKVVRERGTRSPARRRSRDSAVSRVQ
ncbi:hypothetical protein [Salinigranum marinum]|uniref:hypothetical protein n=1 Tax=Salinigranum marinum TaxID=1515595 RepID=UPI002989F77F|nr:hypothetical protein [Salinigranum marinum]